MLAISAFEEVRQLASTAIAKLIAADHAPALLAAPASDFARRAGLPDGDAPPVADNGSRYRRRARCRAGARFVWWRLERVRHLQSVSDLRRQYQSVVAAGARRPTVDSSSGSVGAVSSSARRSTVARGSVLARARRSVFGSTASLAAGRRQAFAADGL